ncbi:deoxycytidine triphosphate deaminase [Streptomyces sp. NBC_00285]|uniref:dCTP deaminase domain-containing protein n=1 Tax=Streptomyces sp. NBC_00285 TaxID=2975700 RepID=UPI002E2CDAEF|nr:PEP/pyruvate-binding domain-containing protein [Streptomyces sp. NBC_00285]
MILTGSEIARERTNDRITIEPFTPEQVNPNSYNFRLGSRLRVYSEMPLDPRRENVCVDIEMGDEGYVLEPGRLYLAHTQEVLGSRHYAPTFAARSSVARLGLFINLSASLGDIGYEGQWTLQLYTVNQVRVYPGMTIGQMMWWRPQGEIELYDGKYQGAVGPRASDIHKDFDRQLSRQRLPGLGTVANPAEVGHKFASLALTSRTYRVPLAFAVPAGELAQALDREARGELGALFEEMRATVGAFFTELTAGIEAAVAGLTVPQDLRELLTARLQDMFGDPEEGEFAVRSSGLAEDSGTSSLAGVHRSVLGVRGADGVIAAVAECWRSHYASSAVAARVRAGDFDPEPRLAVIVQRLVRPTLAGVAFTGLDGSQGSVEIEYTEGLAEELVAGVAVPRRVSAAPGGRIDDPLLAELADTCRQLRQERGCDVDVEWAADEAGLHLVQVRPVTARRLVDEGPAAAGIWSSRLYFEDPPAGAQLGDIAEVYAGYTAKRGPAHRLAEELGLSVGAGWLIGFTARDLAAAEGRDHVRALLATGPGSECVLDLGATLRQIVVPKEQVPDRLGEITRADAQPDRRQAVVVRDFIRGELGLITRRSGTDLLVEYTPDGLLALNRGTAGARSFVRNAGGEDRAEAVDGAPAELVPHLARMAAFTGRMHDRYGDATVEWVFADGEPYFVDYSLLTGDVLSGERGTLVSAGSASGPLLKLADDDLLRRLSVGPAVSVDRSKDVVEHTEITRLLEKIQAMPAPPVVRVSRPYAVLSVLIGSVAGFVFEEGSVLCHLAILLREAKVPALVADDLAPLVDGGEAVISDGVITVAGTAAGRSTDDER